MHNRCKVTYDSAMILFEVFNWKIKQSKVDKPLKFGPILYYSTNIFLKWFHFRLYRK
ncbi:unnamed protein product [Acanthoscelides obtectus]|uniref:Uncharacterized protein n=1 Tax=Acanthoscelides obtectus TaxID=200917 RepID=A0A9P0PVE5_ACAOB|nr:unnamed protein product [Acanthoscelides obtectus]CAK1632699.1 hypothetical protein AOBTE_LOCUS7687 [Acanthoscelides obtectus]